MTVSPRSSLLFTAVLVHIWYMNVLLMPPRSVTGMEMMRSAASGRGADRTVRHLYKTGPDAGLAPRLKRSDFEPQPKLRTSVSTTSADSRR